MSLPQVLALVFIRKLLDFIFSKRELSWLDDLMPESKKKKLEDSEEVAAFASFSLRAECELFHSSNGFYSFNLQEEEQSILAEDVGAVQVPLEECK